MQALRALVMVPVVAVVLVVANGGYVYKTTCPGPSGHPQTSWEYRIFDVIPYVGYDVKGCTSHTATRELLSVLGVWKLPSASAGGTQQIPAAFTHLVTIKSRMDSLDQRENGVHPVRPLTAESLRSYGARLQPYAQEYVRLAKDVVTTRASLGPMSNPDLVEAWTLIQQRTRADSRFLTDIAAELQTGQLSRFATVTRTAERTVNRLDSELSPVLIRLNAKYGSTG